MSNFNLKKSKNPVRERHTVTTEHGSVTFILTPIQSDVEFLIRQFQRLAGSSEVDYALSRIAVARIAGWEGVCDEEGNPVEFNANNFSAWLDLVESVDYTVKLGEYTLEQRFPEKEVPVLGEEKQAEEQIQTPETSENSSETTFQS